MSPDLSSGIIIELNPEKGNGLIQDDFDNKLILHFDIVNFHPTVSHQINQIKIGDHVDYYILYQDTPIATNILPLQAFEDNNQYLPKSRVKFWQRPIFWLNVFCVLLGMLIGAWKNNLIAF